MCLLLLLALGVNVVGGVLTILVGIICFNI